VTERAFNFINIPERSKKPRTVGLTLARDLGYGYVETESWLEAVGDIIDYVKIRHLFVLLMTEDKNDLVRRKIDLYKRNQVEVNPGGIVFEMAVLSKSVPQTFKKLAELGFTAVEISENIVPLTLQDSLDYIKMAKDCGLKVLFEVGDKYPSNIFNVDVAADDINSMVAHGCDLCILEKSQIELCLGEKADNPNAERLKQLVERVGLEKIVFEAEASPHQVWLFKTFGPDVNLGPNLDKDVIAKLEPTRRTLSREGGYGYLSDQLEKTNLGPGD
jgi:phosphosulfolactate synthase